MSSPHTKQGLEDALTLASFFETLDWSPGRASEAMATLIRTRTICTTKMGRKSGLPSLPKEDQARLAALLREALKALVGSPS